MYTIGIIYGGCNTYLKKEHTIRLNDIEHKLYSGTYYLIKSLLALDVSNIINEIIIVVDIKRVQSLNALVNIQFELDTKERFIFSKKVKTYYEYVDKPNFSVLRNKIIQYANNDSDYIIMFDTDEIIPGDISYILKTLIPQNPDIEVYALPRVNIIEDTGEIFVNFPDYQYRIIKNTKDIYYINDVHEIPTNYEKLGLIEATINNSILHIKSSNIQRQQNDFYNSIISNEK